MRSVFTLLLHLFPRAFREQFAADMLEQMSADLDQANRRGHAYALFFSLTTTWDLIRTALAERIDPVWYNADTTTTYSGTGMGMMLNEWVRDLRYAVRTLLRAPGFTAVSVGTLALAVGANAGIFSVVDSVLLTPLPYANADRLVSISATAPGSDLPEMFGVSAEFYHQYLEESTLIEDAATFNSYTNTLRVGDRTERVSMSSPSVSLFSTLGVEPMLGRLPTDEDDSGAVVISQALWTSWFDRSPDVLGQSHYIGGENRVVVGVMGPEFWFPDERTLLWIPRPMRVEDVQPGRFGMAMVARAAPGVSEEALAAELTHLATLLPERFGGSAEYARLIEQHRAIVRPIEERLIGGVATSLWVLLGAMGIVFLIACANVANLFVVRADARQRDMAVRRALGAGRSQLIRAMMAEAVVVSGLAGLGALIIANLALPVFLRAAPEGIPGLGQAGVTAGAIGLAVSACAFAAVVCGLVPALRASGGDLGRLRDGARGSTTGHHRLRDLLVVSQTALALVLLIGSGLLIRSFVALQQVETGYDTEDIYTFQIAPEQRDDLFDGPSYARFHMEFMDRVALLPGVASVGIVENVPLNESVRTNRFLTEVTEAEGSAGALIGFTFSAGNYFETMGIDVLRGRTFTRADHETDFGNALLSESAARLLWPGGEDPVGQRVRMRDLENDWFTVVGVVEDVLQNGLRETAQPLMYLPIVGPRPDMWWVSSPAYVVKTPRTAEIGGEIRTLVHELAPGAPMYRTYTMEGLAADSIRRLSFTMLTLGVASALALLLGAVGLFGVLSYAVGQRTREIGVRMALGAQADEVRRMIVGQGSRVVILGIVLGVAVAAVGTRVLSGLLYGVESADLTTFVGMSATMLLVGMVASYLPARRASGVDPVESLKGV